MAAPGLGSSSLGLFIVFYFIAFLEVANPGGIKTGHMENANKQLDKRHMRGIILNVMTHTGTAGRRAPRQYTPLFYWFLTMFCCC